MITASHNPQKYSGFKITRKGAVPISPARGLDAIRVVAENGLFGKAGRRGRIKRKSIWRAYSRHVNGFGKTGKARIVADSAHGMAGISVENVFKRPLEVVHVNPRLTRALKKIPNPFTDPKTRLRKRVVREKADMGVCFDYDGDRMFFISEKGKKIRSEAIASLLIENYYCRRGEKIVYDVRSGWAIKDTIRKCGCRGKMWKAGHTLIVEKMRDIDAGFCGEASGHYYFRENGYNDSSMIPIVMVLALMRKTGKPLSRLTEKYEKYFQSGETNFHVRDRKEKIAEIAKVFRGGKRSKVDGLRVDYRDWWFNVRPSNTEPVLRINIEAKTKGLLEEKKKRLFSIARKK
jgi:phosphomannomutase